MQQSITSRSEHYCRGKNNLSVGFELEAINALEKGVNVSSCIEPVYGVLNQELVREWASLHCRNSTHLSSPAAAAFFLAQRTTIRFRSPYFQVLMIMSIFRLNL
uniref:Uncharacterized protein n=1 Tax=Aureoumbra lagunensis TaxID=44058 RepID=A0A7S3K072_9STRA